MAAPAVAEVAKLSPQELDEVFGAVADQVLNADDLKAEPKGVQGLLVLAEHGAEMQRRVLDFAKALDVSKVGVWPVGLVSVVRDPALATDAKAVLDGWVAQDGNAMLRRGVQAMGSRNSTTWRVSVRSQ